MLMKQGFIGCSSLAARSKHVHTNSFNYLSLKAAVLFADKNMKRSKIAVAVKMVSVLYPKCICNCIISSMQSARCCFEIIGRR